MSNAYRGTGLQGAQTTTLLTGIGNVSGNECEGLLHSIALGVTASVASLTCYDNTSASGTPVAVLAVMGASAVPSAALLDISLKVGLTVVTTGASSFATITYR